MDQLDVANKSVALGSWKGARDKAGGKWSTTDSVVGWFIAAARRRLLNNMYNCTANNYIIRCLKFEIIHVLYNVNMELESASLKVCT
jgi:hypothetical protein